MPTTPSPYNYNTFRYRKVSGRAKKSGGICGILALAMVAAPIVAIVATTAYFV